MGLEVNILGISCYYHDSAACLVRGGSPVAAAEEERFSRRKHDSGFPAQSAAYCLREGGISAAQLDAIVFYEKPLRKLERVLRTGQIHAPQSALHAAAQLGEIVQNGLNIEETIRQRLQYAGPVYFCEHHLSHAASAFYVSPFERAAILTVDGVGEWATAAHFSGHGERISRRREILYPHSLGLLYSAITAFLGFKVNDDEYKVMGLASYGAPKFRGAFETLVFHHGDGSFSLNLQYFSYMYDNKSMFTPALEALLGPARRPDQPIEPRHQDIAATLQAVTEETLVAMAASCLRDDGTGNLCLAGGVAQNCVANSRILERAGFRAIFVQPAPGDSGAAMGAALWAAHAVHGLQRMPCEHNTLLGPAFSTAEILTVLESFAVRFTCFAEDELCAQVAALIQAGLVVGWFQGRMEFGPRALGARSILGNPCLPDMQDILNRRVKFRENFRPFAPAVIEEAASDYFELSGASPFMLLTPRVHAARRAEIPAVTHVDGTARVQTVSRAQQPLFHKLISAFGALSGTPMVINTSFNIRGEPIVCTPEDAVRCFLGTDIDFLAIGPFLVRKV